MILQLKSGLMGREKKGEKHPDSEQIISGNRCSCSYLHFSCLKGMLGRDGGKVMETIRP